MNGVRPGMARPPEIGPPRMRVLPARDNGREEDLRGEATTTYPEQIIRKLREADRIAGAEVPELVKALEVSEQTYTGSASAAPADP
jgi:hypothetical protein